MALNETHDPAARSWVPSANDPATDFPIQNLPHGVFSTVGTTPRGGIAIGAFILDLHVALAAGLFAEDVRPLAELAARPLLNDLLAQGNVAAAKLRGALFALLREGPGSAVAQAIDGLLVAMDDATLHMPVRIGAFTDFMTSVHHVTAARRSRPARPLNENFLHLPVAYNSRASTITVGGIDFPRPWGQWKNDEDAVVFAPTAKLDFEVEFGALVGPGNAIGSPVLLDASDDHIFGYVIVNDWSARDVQVWEQRLGPFLGKAFRSTISPWIVTAEAVAPFRAPAPARKPGEPQPLPYLDSPGHRENGALDVALKATLRTARMRDAAVDGQVIVETNLLECAWTLPQMLTHHTSGGCALEPGDLLSSGTVSGPTDESAGCLFEITAGTLPIALPGGEQRTWLEDGDEFVITARCERPGFTSIGFGNCGATVQPALPYG